MTSTTTTTGWAIRRKRDGKFWVGRLSVTFRPMFSGLQKATLFMKPHPPHINNFKGCEVVPITRTVTVEIGEAQPEEKTP